MNNADVNLIGANLKVADLSEVNLKVASLEELVNSIVIDLDIQDKNLEAAAKFPPAYETVNGSGNGIHLYYKR